MKILGWLGLLIGLAAWGYATLMGINLLSGPMEDRVCKTDCVLNYFFISGALAAVALIFGLLSLSKFSNKIVPILSTLLGLGLVGIYGFLYIAGNFF